jgi:PAP2 superfamily.
MGGLLGPFRMGVWMRNSRITTRLKQLIVAHQWLAMAVLLFFLFFLYSGLLATNALTYPTLYVERLLLFRPITRVDCVLERWAQLGDINISILQMGIVGAFFLLLSYRRRTFLIYVGIFFSCVAIEMIGKRLLLQLVPSSMGNALNMLRCPQLATEPYAVRHMVTFGMTWAVPRPPAFLTTVAQQVARQPIVIDAHAIADYGYPSGHAIRAMFIGLVACWLVYHHLQRWRWLRWGAVILLLSLSFGVGFVQFYISYHLWSDVFGGYLVGAGAACCTIELMLSDKLRRW